jgi:hypothetical protein
MTRINTSPRAKRGTRRLAIQEMREALRDGRLWTGLGVVAPVEEGGDHWVVELDDESNEIDVLVSVVIMPNEEPHMCRLAGPVWRVPPVGTEVGVIFPGGEPSGEGILLGQLSSGAPPAGLDADTLVMRAPGLLIVAEGGDVEVYATGKVKLGADGGALQGVALGASLKAWLDGHTHPGTSLVVDPSTHAVTGSVLASISASPAPSATVEVTP